VSGFMALLGMRLRGKAGCVELLPQILSIIYQMPTSNYVEIVTVILNFFGVYRI
jgi:hypothetical protein